MSSWINTCRFQQSSVQISELCRKIRDKEQIKVTVKAVRLKLLRLRVVTMVAEKA